MRPRPRTAVGSSPLTRGKPQIVQLVGQVGGLIPAHAGKTHRPLRRAIRSVAHPRSRGENTPLYLRLALTAGSSPLTRGKRRRCWSAFQSIRLIPAHAGKTALAALHCGGVRAHPRSRGENRPADRLSLQAYGSSPLTRGKRVCQLVTSARWGLIPAHAGKTRGGESNVRYRAAHPRSRGENAEKPRNADDGPGSSPLTRGKRFELQESREDTGLIPAHAGKTPRWCPRPRGARAHPRSRGENFTSRTRPACGTGSSPLTRGKPAGRRYPA